MFKKTRQFLADVKFEFKKVTWPTKEQTLKQTGVVMVLTAITSVFLGVVDYGLSEVFKQVIG
ncbi:MAG: preprotein translocase subunit SecE [Deltaproteobacteria bacterium]|nr:preprotein translocase subunit SecE [Deltaproteobacteria bacterium]